MPYPTVPSPTPYDVPFSHNTKCSAIAKVPHQEIKNSDLGLELGLWIGLSLEPGLVLRLEMH